MDTNKCFFFALCTIATLNAEQSPLQKPAYPSAMATQALINLFDTITTLLHSPSQPAHVAQFLNDMLGTVLSLIAQASDKKGAELDLFMTSIKTNCKHVLRERIAALTQDTEHEEWRRPSHQEKDPAATQAMLCNIANVVSGVVTIAQNPHDKDNVKLSIGSILCGIINIAVNASHRSLSDPLLHCAMTLATSPHLA